MSRQKGIGPRLTELANTILTRVQGENVPLEIQLDAFKLLTSFHVGTMRVAKHAADEPDEGSILSLKEKIAGHNGGRAIHERN